MNQFAGCCPNCGADKTLFVIVRRIRGIETEYKCVCGQRFLYMHPGARDKRDKSGWVTLPSETITMRGESK
jgi:hypothetical protein